MEPMTVAEVINAVNSDGITENTVGQLMTSGDVEAEIITVTTVKPAAAFKDVRIQKVTKANVILPSSGKTYAEMVKKSATELGSESEKVESFTTSESNYEHTAVYPVCVSKKSPDKKYLYCIYKNVAQVVYVKDGKECCNKESIVEFLTPSEAKKLLEEKTAVTNNVTHGISHNVAVRTLTLDNVKELRRTV